MRDRGLVRPAYQGTTPREHLFGAGHARLPASHVGSGRRPAPGPAAMA